MNSMDEHIDIERLETCGSIDKFNEQELTHLNSCDMCRENYDMIHQLKGLEAPRSELKGLILVRKIRAKKRLIKVMRLAAILLISFSVVTLSKMGTTVSSKADALYLNDSIAWLKNEQVENGSWNVKKWGGKDRFKLGVSSLAFMSLLELEKEGTSDSIEKGLQYIESQFNEDGSFGPKFLGDLYNHSLATLALRKAKEKGYSVSDNVIVKSTEYLKRYRHSNGLWSYREGGRTEVNLSAWALLAMKEPQTNIEVHEDDSQASLTFGHESQGMKSSAYIYDPMDVYLKMTEEFEWGAWKESLLDQQIKEGELTGTWPIDGKWSRVGGRVFSTGMALLSIASN